MRVDLIHSLSNAVHCYALATAQSIDGREPGLSFTSNENLGKLFNLSLPQFPMYTWGNSKIYFKGMDDRTIKSLSYQEQCLIHKQYSIKVKLI